MGWKESTDSDFDAKLDRIQGLFQKWITNERDVRLQRATSRVERGQ
ncbi:hypothetical protein [Streptomyces sp. HB132]|nr:hypothetical protein [Streptomyces sp. HB132]MBM7439314.1 hypothetical protein [Streptomyces sp. HB132]